MMTQITMQIPAAAFDAMASTTPANVYSDLIENGQTALINVLTFGYINTPIVDNRTGVIVAYVTLWEDKHATVCKADSDTAHLIGVTAHDGDFGTLEAMLIFNAFWEE